MNGSEYPYIAFDPVAFSLGPLDVHWYGIMYLLGFLFFWAGGNWLARHRPWWGWTPQMVGDMLFYGMLGVVLGGRLGYVLFYGLDSFLADPMFLFRITQGGMSFHGGMLGVIAALVWFAWRRRQDWLAVTDFIAPLVPLALGAGRLGNFINAELWGRPAEVPWAMVFPNVDRVPRHPSQLYEFALEGVVLFAVLWWFSRRPRPRGAVSGAFLLGYGLIRFLVEFTREPDHFLGLLALGFSMGQWLSAPMIIAGAAMIVWAYRARERER